MGVDLHAHTRPKGRAKGVPNRITRQFKAWGASVTVQDAEWRELKAKRIREGKEPHLEKFILEHIVGKPRELDAGPGAMNHGFTLVLTGGASVTQLGPQGRTTLMLGHSDHTPTSTPTMQRALDMPDAQEIFPADPSFPYADPMPSYGHSVHVSNPKPRRKANQAVPPQLPQAPEILDAPVTAKPRKSSGALWKARKRLTRATLRPVAERSDPDQYTHRGKTSIAKPEPTSNATARIANTRPRKNSQRPGNPSPSA